MSFINLQLQRGRWLQCSEYNTPYFIPAWFVQIQFAWQLEHQSFRSWPHMNGIIWNKSNASRWPIQSNTTRLLLTCIWYCFKFLMQQDRFCILLLVKVVSDLIETGHFGSSHKICTWHRPCLHQEEVWNQPSIYGSNMEQPSMTLLNQHWTTG